MKEASFYLIPFFHAVSISVLAGWLLTKVLEQGSGAISRYARRFGGVIMIITFCVASLRDEYLVIDLPLRMLMGSLLAVMVFGVADDLFRFSWRKQLVFQGVIALVLFGSGSAIQSIGFPWGGGAWVFEGLLGWWLSMLLSVVWLVLIVNAINWVDGVDGVAGSVSLVGFFAIFLLSLRPEVNQPPVAILAVIATGVTAGFLFFNMPPARFIAGTSGAYFWGLLLGTLSIFAGTKIATTTLVLAVPILDALWVMIERWRHGVSVFQGDTRYHLHYRLREYGWSDRSIVVAYSLVALSIGLVAPFLSSTGKGWLLCGLGIVLIGFLSLFHRKTSACI